jgi:lysyl-tRNA synthetase, class II
MLFKISPDILRDFPSLKIGIISACGISNKQQNNEVAHALHKQQEVIKTIGKEKLTHHPYLQSWRNAYKKFGAKPKEYLSSIDNMVHRILKDKPIRSINTLVDLYNLISLKYLLPLGSEDLEQIVGDLELTYAGNHEAPVTVLGETAARSPEPGEVIYKDKLGTICRRWNWREVERTKITEQTQNALIVLEALAPADQAVLEIATHELAQLIEKYCGGTITLTIVDVQNSEIKLKEHGSCIKLEPIQASRIKLYDVYTIGSHEEKEHTVPEHAIRVEKVKKMRELGIEPWPDNKPVAHTCCQVIQEYTEHSERVFTIAGRVMSMRIHGKTAFGHIQDDTGKLQIYIKKDLLGDEQFKRFEEFIDIGDIIWCSGTAFVTKTGEITLQVTAYTLLSKCLFPLPEKFHGLTDIETKYRHRYLDLMTNSETRERFIKRSQIVRTMRRYLDDHGYIEVETPMLHPIAGGAAARPFVTHHNALGTDFFLRIAPELYLKRLVVGGLERVYEINRNFRNEGISTRHNPEFTMIEFYTAYQDYTYSMNFVEKLLQSVAQTACGKLQVTYGNYSIDFSTFERLTIKQSVIKYGNLSEHDLSQDIIDMTLAKLGFVPDSPTATVGAKIYLLFEKLVEHKLIQPTFIIDFPIEISPLAKRDSRNPLIAPRYELFIGGMEIANSYNELNDPFDQADRFKEQLESHRAGNLEAHQYDTDFVHALEYGLPPTVGVGVGIDRLVMLLTGSTSIKEIILFPTLKPKDL